MPEAPPDHYRVLSVDPFASPDEIRRAYRTLARRHHPDVSGDDRLMKALNLAWEILGDPTRRAAHDRERLAAAHPDHAGPPPGGSFGPVMTFGRYAGWSLGEIGRHDPGFLQWLRRAPIGRSLVRDIDAVLVELAARPTTLGGRRPAFGAGGAAFGRRPGP